ncbi:AAA-ATPase At3g28610-like [Cryptomeria japonica]|uniref:AAA-ATPase At3g28610-like n=1 Tax=Cryptomeria japonica TaxID=3369 RepID=UPI0027DA9187|nr:AAA-ATPase At3g28610-like [Cryptomeria japonica]
MLYNNKSDVVYGYGWTHIPFKHSSTLDTIALDPPLKRKILMDLDRFKRGKEFYSRIGRSWKRAYLLQGPPRTRKSSLVPVRNDLYDLELTRVKNNAEFRALLTQTKEKSVIIIEDIDCSLHRTDRVSRLSDDDEEEKSSSKVTLSGFLNFIDGLWSCCGEERVIVFTTNHKDMFDLALLRSGRMDMHILFSFCTFPAFKSLAFNYLEIEDHLLFSIVEVKMGCVAEMTPADFIEVLMNKMDGRDEASPDLISALDGKKRVRNAPLTS